jgi:glutamate--cysteine ligase
MNDDVLDQRLDWLAGGDNAKLIRNGLKGIERETLRVTVDGSLSESGHPPGLGSALTNRFITTDYSEALLEFVTPAYPSTWEVQQFLCDVHQFVYAHINDELLWAASMPCGLLSDEQIPIARYGSSNVGMMKSIYRRGLGHRYGRMMQTIAGVHFNYSMPIEFWPALKEQEGNRASLQHFRSDIYMAMVRNFRRYGWLVLYLFGMSPALCKSFLPEGSAGLSEFDDTTWAGRYATSLRMSGLGYQNDAQAGLAVSANSLHEYVADLSAAIATPSKRFQEIGVRVDGEYRQLSSNQLQIENEYYSTIRPKRRAVSGQRPTEALREEGVEYVEVRALDVNLFDPTGVDQVQMRFLEAFVIYCGLLDGPAIGVAEQQEIDERHSLVARSGREPGLELVKADKSCSLREWALELVDGIGRVAALLDDGNHDYSAAVAAQREVCLDVDKTPSAQILARMADSGLSFSAFAMGESLAQQDYFHALKPLPKEKYRLFAEETLESMGRQAAIEADENEAFDQYLQRYFGTGIAEA